MFEEVNAEGLSFLITQIFSFLPLFPFFLFFETI